MGDTPDVPIFGLDHVLVVAGDRPTWERRSTADWSTTARQLAPVVAAAGGRWLTVRPYGWPAEAPIEEQWVALSADEPGSAGCTVIVDPAADGKQAFATAAAAIVAADAGPVAEQQVAGALYAPADVEPDLIVICGPDRRLPPSLVWELAYGELVYSSASLDELDGELLQRAITDYRARTRRFGGL